MRIARGVHHSTADSRVGRGRRLPFHLGLVHHGSSLRRRISGLCARLGDDTYWFSIH